MTCSPHYNTTARLISTSGWVVPSRIKSSPNWERMSNFPWRDISHAPNVGVALALYMRAWSIPASIHLALSLSPHYLLLNHTVDFSSHFAIKTALQLTDIVWLWFSFYVAHKTIQWDARALQMGEHFSVNSASLRATPASSESICCLKEFRGREKASRTLCTAVSRNRIEFSIAAPHSTKEKLDKRSWN